MAFIQPDLKRTTTDGGSSGPTCFLSGTRIATSEGAVCVEDLAVGSVVLTASGDVRPVRWLGHRGFDCSRYPDSSVVCPVRIQAGAFAPDTPARDLFVSPGHSIFTEGVLVQAFNLINGATITQVARDRVDYWHVELDSHDIVLAEGLPAESYLDTGNRTAFVGGGAFLEAYPDFKPKHWRETCQPLVVDGPVLHTIRAHLLARAQELGYALTEDSDVHILSQGKRIEPMPLAPNRFAFVMPDSASDIELRCRSFIPAAVEFGSDDGRVLGINVARLQIDGVDWDLTDETAFANGWHPLEQLPDGKLQRWSKERVTLPANTRLVVIEHGGDGQYWATSQHDPAIQNHVASSSELRRNSGAANS
jgi:hypothetical protein